jgi:hypothetical protein
MDVLIKFRTELKAKKEVLIKNGCGIDEILIKCSIFN